MLKMPRMVAVLGATLAALLIVGAALAQTQPPHTFFGLSGDTTVDGESAAPGTVITAMVDGASVGTATVAANGWSLELDGGMSGVTFMVGELMAEGSYSTSVGGTTRLMLAVTTPEPEPVVEEPGDAMDEGDLEGADDGDLDADAPEGEGTDDAMDEGDLEGADDGDLDADAPEGEGTDDAMGTEDGDDAMGTEDGDDAMGTEDGDDAMGTEDGDDAMGTEDGDDAMGTEDGDDAMGTEDGDDVMGTEDGDDAMGTEDGDDAMGTEDGDDAMGTEDGDDAMGTEDGDDAMGTEDGEDAMMEGEGDGSLLPGTGSGGLADRGTSSAVYGGIAGSLALVALLAGGFAVRRRVRS